MSATIICYLIFPDILVFHVQDSQPKVVSVKCKRYMGIKCKNLWVTSFFYIFQKMTKNMHISCCRDFYELKISEGAQNIRTIKFFQESLLIYKYLWLTGTEYNKTPFQV